LGYTGALGINKASSDDNEIYKYLLSELQKAGYDFYAAQG
jgi:hypothetical protein